MSAFRGDRRVWAAGAAVLLATLGCVAWQLLREHVHLTGTNSVAVRAVVVDVADGSRVCIPGLSVPAGSARVELAAVWGGPRRPGMVVTVEAGRHRNRAVVPSRAEPGTATPVAVVAPLGEPEIDGESVPGRLCMTPIGGSFGLGGMQGIQGDQPSPTLDGNAVGNRVTVRFLPPEGERATLLSLLPEAFERAALFRPGIVGSWLYLILFAVAGPVLWLVSLRLLATRAAGSHGGRRIVLAVTTIAVVNAFAWALLTPAWQGPDEPDHFAFTQTLAENGRAPSKASSEAPAYSTSAAFAFEALHTSSTVGLVDGKPPWLEADEERYRRRATAQVPEHNGGGFLIPSSPHSPAYYGLTVAGYAAFDSQSVFTQLAAMRLISALLAGLAAACAFLTVRELAPRSEWLAVTAGLLLAFQPMVAFMFGVVNNDAGVNAAAALVVYLLIRGLRRGLTIPLGLALGAALVALPAMKGTGFALYPAAAVGLAGMLWRRHARRDVPGYAAAAGGGAALAGLWALVAGLLDTKPFTTPGGGAAEGLHGTIERVLDQPAGFLSYTWQMFLPRLSFMTDLHLQGWPAYDVYLQGGWAAFGWLVVRFPPWVYQLIAGISLAAAVLCAIGVWRERRRARALGWELTVLVLVLAGVVAGVEAVYFTTTPRGVPAEQGRYIFTALVPLAAIAVGSCLAFGRRLAPVWGAMLVAAVMGLGYASQLLTLSWFFT